MASDAAAEAIKPKQRRAPHACDFCHQRSIRCRPSGDGTNCTNCKSFAQACTYLRKPRRRGPPPRSSRAPASRRKHQQGEDADEAEPTPSSSSRPTSMSVLASYNHHRGPQLRTPRAKWTAPQVASQATVMDLAELYFEVVYPIFPFFHQPSFIRTVSRGEYLESKTLFATTMAVCALVGSRVRDGSVTNPRWDMERLTRTSPDVFYSEARRQLSDITEGSDFNSARAHAVLAITAIQNGKVRDMHQHLGIYHTLVVMESLHDESNWPQDISVIEREERRRLFWSIYTLDIYTAAVWGGILRSREQQSNVAYPTELDDELIDEAGTHQARLGPVGTLNVHTDCWLSGWNFITDLYRVLEHALVRFRGHRNRVRRRSFLHDIFEDESHVTETSVCNSVLQMYINLPSCFKKTPRMTYNVNEDRFGFQAANITATVQLVRMVLFTAGGASIEERCLVAREVVDSFASIPVEYLVSISAPLLHHLGGIGAVLGSVFEEQISQLDYTRVRSIMLSMAQLLKNLEAIHQRSSASEKLRAQVAKIDEYMVSQQQAALPATEIQTQGQGQMPAGSSVGVLPGQGDTEAGGPGNSVDAVGDGWSFQVPPDLLGDLAWTFDLSQSWN